METMTATWDWFTEHMLVHWPWLVGCLGFYVIGKFMSAQVWTKKRAFTKGKMRQFFHLIRRTMAAHPIITGLILGGVPGMPVSPGVEGLASAVLYWGSAGLCSSFAVHMAAQWVKKKTDGAIDFEKSIEDAVNPSMVPSTPPKGVEKPLP